MFSFTKQEQLVLNLFVCVVLSGSLLQVVFKKYPSLPDIVNLIDSDSIYFKVDVNSASFEELVSIPYIGEYTASNIIKYRQEHGPFTARDQLKQVSGIRDKNYQKFLPHIKRLSRKWKKHTARFFI